ncbi:MULTISPECIES: aldolase/citrate lyase family protein [Rhodomicrobium]|uniref:HpcH/HpaI aldolase family protein n=1 Tax=Rhodomicrobium TaxID=1068 RepID=UPI000B4B741C|nr:MULTISPECIES: aldolase/citrate lyase family protein [Rhodomicrobium]
MNAEVGGGPIRAKVAAGKPLFNAWLSLGAAFAVELVAEAGADLVTIDQQHGIGGHAEMMGCLTAATAGGVPALVRVSVNDSGLIGRALDAGAHGVICPMINTAEDAAAFVGSVKFPPLGRRSLGPFRARLAMPDYFRAANGWTIACGQIETRTALGNLDGILSTAGLDMICAGPNDLALTLSGGAHSDIRAPEVIEALDLLLAKCREHGVISAIFANDAAYAKSMIAKGWQVVTISTEARWLSEGARAARRVIDGVE